MEWILLFILTTFSAQAQLPKQTAQTKLDADGKRASKFISPDKSCEEGAPETPLSRAARATVQILPKFLVGRDGNRFVIKTGEGWYCKGHPLAGQGEPHPGDKEPLAKRTSAGAESGLGDGVQAKTCSGFLAGDQKTIATAAHCFWGKDPAKFCEENVIVFGRACGNETYSADQVAECDGQTKIVNTIKDVQTLNLHTDDNSKDHAFIRLKKAVPESVAQALKFGSPESQKTGDRVYAIGHPGGSPRMIAPLKVASRQTVVDKSYCFTKYDGYIYPGNSGGPLVDESGAVVGIAASVDDKKYGNQKQREPMIEPPGGGMCTTQVAGANTVVGVDACPSIKQDAQAFQREPAQKPQTLKSGSDSPVRTLGPGSSSQ